MRPGDVAGMCLIYGASREVTEALVALAKEMNNPGWWRSHLGAIPKWFDTFIGLEQSASHIRLYTSEFVPGLLQTEAYAEATLRAVRPALSDTEVADGVVVRMRRQRILTRKAPQSQSRRRDACRASTQSARSWSRPNAPNAVWGASHADGRARPAP